MVVAMVLLGVAVVAIALLVAAALWNPTLRDMERGYGLRRG